MYCDSTKILISHILNIIPKNLFYGPYTLKPSNVMSELVISSINKYHCILNE